MNIIIRMFMYLADTYHTYYVETKQTLYASKKVSFPKPELYMIYLGEKGGKKEIISLSEEFLDGEGCSLEVKVKVIFGGKEGYIINQYLIFTKIYNEQMKLHKRTREAVIQTIRICKDRNILRDYLQKREKEVVTIMMALFDAEYNLDLYAKNVAEQSEEKGREEGIKSIVEICREIEMSFEDTVKKVSEKLNLSNDKARLKVNQYW